MLLKIFVLGGRKLRKIIMVFLVAMLCVSSTVFAQGNITEDGSRVNKGKLSKEEELIVEKRSEEVGRHFLAVAKAKAKLDEMSEHFTMQSKQVLSAQAELEELEKGYQNWVLSRLVKRRSNPLLLYLQKEIMHWISLQSIMIPKWDCMLLKWQECGKHQLLQ